MAVVLNEKNKTVIGDSAPDMVDIDKNENYTIKTNDGNDVIVSGGGNDTIYGGKGNDKITAGKGNDKIYGDAGANGIYFNEFDGNDTLFSGKDGYDHIYLETSYSKDEITFSKNNNDLVIRYSETDTITISNYFKNKGVTSFQNIYLNADKEIVCNLNKDYNSIYNLVVNKTNNINKTINGTNFDEILNGSEGFEKIYGNAGNDTINSGYGNDTVYGGAGQNIIDGGRGDDKLYSDKKAQIDTFVFDSFDGNDTIYANAEKTILDFSKTGLEFSIDEIAGESFRYIKSGNDLIINYATSENETGLSSVTISNYFKSKLQFELIYNQNEEAIDLALLTKAVIGAENKKNNLTGSSQNDYIKGFGFNDVIKGGLGNDTIEAGAGNDKIYGDGGDDLIVFGFNSGVDTVYSGTGEDTLYFEQIYNYSDLTFTKDKNDLIISSKDNAQNRVIIPNYFKGNSSVKYVQVNGQEAELIEPNVVQTIIKSGSITGTGIADEIIGSGLNDNIKGGLGNDTIDAGAGNDKIYGDGGDDLIVFGFNSGIDTVYSGTGEDTLYFEQIYNYDDLIFTKDKNDLIISKKNNAQDRVVITNYYKGNSSVKYIQVNGQEAELLEQNAIQKIIKSGSITGTGIADEIIGSNSNDNIKGGLGNDYIDAGDGDDKIYGDGGNDTIIAGSGNSLIYDSDGDDHYEIGDNLSDSFITISDSKGHDTLNLDYSKNDLVFFFDVKIDKNGNLINSKNSELYVISENEQFYSQKGKSTPKFITGLKINNYFTTGTVEEITFKNSSTSMIQDDFLAIKEDIAFWLKENGYSSTYDVLKKGDVFDIEALLEIYSNTNSSGSSISNGKTASLVSNDADYISNLYGSNLIISGKSNDTIDLYSPANNIETIAVYAGKGDDQIELNIEDGLAVVYGEDGNDEIEVYTGNFILDGGNGNDTIKAWQGYTTINGGNGNDLIQAYDCDPVIDAGKGNDTIIATSGIIQFCANSGNDVIYSEYESMEFSLENIDANSKDFELTVDGSSLVISKPDGSTLTLSDYFNLNTNITLIDYDGNTSSLEEIVSILGLKKEDETKTYIGTEHNDSIRSGSYNKILSGDGNDSISFYEEYELEHYIDSGNGNDEISVNSENSTIFAGAGDDEIYVNTDSSYSSSYIDAGDGHDEINISVTNSTVIGGKGDDTIAVWGDEIVTNIKFGANSGNDILAFDEWSENETIILEFTNALQSNLKYSVNGNSLLIKQADGSTLTLTGYFSMDKNITVVDKNNNSYLLSDIVSNQNLQAGTSSVYNGTSHRDVIISRPDESIINLGAGNDYFSSYTDLTESIVINAEDGNDEVYIESGGDISVYGGNGNDSMHAGSFESSSDIYVDGGNGNDELSTYQSSSTICGGAGDDTIMGYSDVYVFGANSGKDMLIYEVWEDGEYSSVLSFTETAHNKLTYSVNGSNLVISQADGSSVSITNYFNLETKNLIIRDKNNVEKLLADIVDEKSLEENNANTIYNGTSNDDRIIVTTEKTINAAAGNDSISSWEEELDECVINCAEGDDTVYISSSNSTIYGGAGNDSIMEWGSYDESPAYSFIDAGSGNDFICVGYSETTIIGGTGDDTMEAWEDATYIFDSNSGNDVIYCSDAEGCSTLDFRETQISNLEFSSKGSSLIIKQSNGNTVTIIDYFNIDDSNFVIKDKTGEEINLADKIEELKISKEVPVVKINGTDGNDWVALSKDASLVNTGNGNDTIRGYYYNEDFVEKTDTIYAGSGNDYIQSASSNVLVYGEDGDDEIEIHADNATIYGGNGNDTIQLFNDEAITTIIDGGNGNDLIELYAPNVTINGGSGNDTIRGSFTVAKFDSNSGNDVIDFDALCNFSEDISSTFEFTATSLSNLSLSADGANLVIKQSTGNQVTFVDYFEYTNLDITVKDKNGNTASLANMVSNAHIQKGQDCSTITGTSGDDYIYSTVNASIVNSLDGNDTIEFYTEQEYVTINSGNGDDFIEASNFYVYDKEFFAYINSGNGNDTIDSCMSSSTIYAGSGNDSIHAMSYSDGNTESFIDAGDGNDIIRVDTSTSTIIGGAGNDTIFAEAYGYDASGYNLRFDANSGNDVFFFTESETILNTTFEFTETTTEELTMLSQDSHLIIKQSDGNSVLIADYFNLKSKHIVSITDKNGVETNVYDFISTYGITEISLDEVKQQISSWLSQNSGGGEIYQIPENSNNAPVIVIPIEELM